ncbi:MAG: hypothetical protein R6V53_05125 [Candidatus Woesearchaeota archaeon]
MAFIRIKRRPLKSKEVWYAYLVKNVWDKKKNSSRQNVSKYLGKCLEGTPANSISFEEFTGKDIPSYIHHSSSRIISDLVQWEIRKHDFSEEVSYKKSKKGVFAGDSECVLMINQGHMCGYTIRRLFNFRPNSQDEHEVGLELAKRFTEAGISIPRELFVAFFEKVATIEY